MATSASGQRCRCTLALSGSDIAVKCKGEARIERTVGRTFSAPVEILPGLRLFGDPFETGQRSFLVVENREIELRDIHFTDNLCQASLNLQSAEACVCSSGRFGDRKSDFDCEFNRMDSGLHIQIHLSTIHRWR